MKRFYQVIQTPSSSGLSSPVPNSSSCPIVHDKYNVLDLDLPKPDPGERKQISQYSYNERDRIRRHYIQKGPFQPRDHTFPKKEFGGLMRQFNPDWFHTSYSEWHDEVNKVLLENAPQNNMMISPSIQKEIVNACAKEIMKAIVKDVNGDYFGILVDESKDVSHKEQMALLQLTLVAVAKKHYDVDQFFDIVANVLNIVGGSFKRMEILREDQEKKLEELLVLGEVRTGSGLNQELGLQRLGDTHWGSHFKTVRNFFALCSLIVHVLEVIGSEDTTYLERSMAKSLVNDIRSFEFVHMLQLMLKVLEITNDLNMTLQRKDQDIVNAMKLVGFAKRQLQSMREFKWESLIEDVSSYCVKHDIIIPEMDKNYHIGESKRKSSSVIYSHHLHVEVFNVVIDLQLAKLNSRFDAVNSDLPLGMASLSLDNSFANYDKDKIMKLVTLYRDDFSVSKLDDLSYKLDNYILFMREDSDFSNLKGL
ncbi:uncharacterized protein LOC132610102 [Lycium barbarum]|uniref:uncharacterized protein LOC132610102 n=1 Tax=Lycium barbarum TaxID=112863 RepID=UPI00293EB197|nr:uncharacterized protein LOC132610102 [Lycium barbarum]